MVRLAFVADLHEHLVEVPACDLLLIAGDVSFAFKGDLRTKHAFLAGPFADWLERAPAEEIVLVAGNHDQSIERWGLPAGLHCHYLQDEGIELFGLAIWGTPWQPWFHDWAFNAPRRHGEEFLASKFDRIPPDTDIIVGHGPPLGYGDLAVHKGTGQHVGSSAMTDALRHVAPSLMVCGHIHSAYGRYRLGNTEIINASLVDDRSRAVNPVLMLDLEASASGRDARQS